MPKYLITMPNCVKCREAKLRHPDAIEVDVNSALGGRLISEHKIREAGSIVEED